MTPTGTTPGAGVPDSVADSTCPGCNSPVAGRKWCSEACRERHRPHRARKGRNRQRDTRDRSERRRAPDKRVRTERRKRRRVAGVDGETIDNRYVLLVAAEDDGETWRAENPAGLSTDECFSFLTSLPKDVIYWGFAFRYDVNMMLGDVPPHVIERLQTEGECYYGPWRIEYRGGKKLVISKRKGSGKHRRTVATFTLWDMYPWVQTSFVKWLRKWKLAGEQTIERIDSMKQLRSSFNPSQRAAIRKYCEQECQFLAAGARRLLELIDVTGLPVYVYNSPASVAKAAMARAKVLEYSAEPPAEVRGHIDAAYHGGRAEISEVGILDGPFYSYDLNSAYPAMAVDLPCLAHGTWEHDTREIYVPHISLLQVSWRERQGITWGPFPLQPRVGSKRYPTSGKGWYWNVEVEAAVQAGYHVTVHDAWRFIPRCDHRPFDYLHDMYELRKQLQADDDESQIIYKLALNSTYGVLAEHPHKKKGEWVMPKYRNMMWAGLICAGIRAQLLDVLSDDVVFLATDCAVSRSPLQVNTGDELGAWGHDPDKDVYDRMFVFGTGQYFKNVGGEWTSDVKTRGFNPREINREALEKLWLAKGRAGVYKFKRQRFIGYGTALRRIGGMWPPMLRCWRTFITESVAKRFDMTPRRVWATEDVMDGRTVAPSQTLHKATEKADRAELDRLYEQYDKHRAQLDRCERREARGLPAPFKVRTEMLIWKDMLAITSMSGSADHGRLLPPDCEPIAWGDDF